MAAADAARRLRRAISERCADTGIEPGHDEIGDRARRRRTSATVVEHGALHDRVVADVALRRRSACRCRGGRRCSRRRRRSRAGRRWPARAESRSAGSRCAGHSGRRSCARAGRRRARSDVVLAHDFEHRGADDAREVADPAEADGKARHDQDARADRSDRPVSPAPIIGNQCSCDGEDQQRSRCATTKDGIEMVPTEITPVNLSIEAVAADGRIAAERNADQRRPAEPGARSGPACKADSP